MKRLWMIDAGHGGLDGAGIYHTPGKKQYFFTQHNQSAYEGAYNRLVAGYLMAMLANAGKKFEYLTPGFEDISLGDRVTKANQLYAKDKSAVYLSIHGNSATADIKGDGSRAHGDEIYTSTGTTSSDKFASVFAEVYKASFPNRTYRLDGSAPDHKQANFYVLRKTAGPAVLFENGFFDNWTEWSTWMNTEAGQRAYAKAIFDGIEKIEERGI